MRNTGHFRTQLDNPGVPGVLIIEREKEKKRKIEGTKEQENR
jgi:3-hydroxymyristoyl/3-hydroxydecanoyl-(acyl carrier protein) dehydratase